MLDADELTALAESRGGIRISLFLPTRRGRAESSGNRLRLKNLLRHAAHALAAEGVASRQVDTLLRPVRQFTDDPHQLNHPSDGLALFVGPDTLRVHRVPIRLPHLAAVGNRFVVRPLLPLLGMNARFFVLALNDNELWLCEGGPSGLQEVTLDGMQLAVWQTMPRRQPRLHAFVADRGGPTGRAVFHGDPEDDHDERLYQHFRRVDRSLRRTIGHDAPVVLCGVRRLQVLYCKANTYRHLVEGGIDGNIRDMAPELLYRRARTLAEPMLRRLETSAAATNRALQGTGRTTNDPVTILEAACHGQVETLFLSVDAPGWKHDPEVAPVVHVADGEGDPLDRAAVQTLCRGGRVYAVPAARMPTEDPVAATLRY